YYGSPPAAPYSTTFYVYGQIRRVSPFTSGDPCRDPATPEWSGAPLNANVPCDPTPPANTTCAIEMRSAVSGEVLASAPIAFEFPPPVCYDSTTATNVNHAVFVAAPCSDRNKRALALEIIAGPQHG